LRAFQHLITSLTTSDNGFERTIKGFILELYAYFAVVANITPFGLDEDRVVPFDPVLSSIGELLAGYDTFGILFSSLHDLFSLIPLISLLARRRLQQEEQEAEEGEEEVDGRGMPELDFKTLKDRIEGWEPSGLCQSRGSGYASELEQAWSSESRIVGEIYRNSILIYLKAAMCGSMVASNLATMREIQHHVAVVLPLFMLVTTSSVGAILLWPTMIVCSCIVDKHQQSIAKATMRECRFSTGNIEQAVELLDRLWQDTAPEAFGPFGLHGVMKKTGINFCMS
jgi:Fungal specific transcription factor domain